MTTLSYVERPGLFGQDFWLERGQSRLKGVQQMVITCQTSLLYLSSEFVQKQKVCEQLGIERMGDGSCPPARALGMK